jgi:uncharacterized protein
MPRKIESLFLAGSAGRLEALLEEPDHNATGIALVCHPHPQHGGTMHNKVVFRLAKGLRRSGHVVMRFNYRGVNLSEGEYAHGEGEPALPLTLAGFSFGSRIALRMGCDQSSSVGTLADVNRPAARRIIAVGFPTIYKDRTFLDNCSVPRIFIQSTRDQYGPMEELRPLVEALPEPKQLIWIDAQDHFFAGATGRIRDPARLRRVLDAGLNAGETEFALKATGCALADQVGDLAEQAGDVHRLDKHRVFTPRKIRPNVLVGCQESGSRLVIHHFRMRQDLQACLR